MYGVSLASVPVLLPVCVAGAYVRCRYVPVCGVVSEPNPLKSQGNFEFHYKCLTFSSVFA